MRLIISSQLLGPDEVLPSSDSAFNNDRMKDDNNIAYLFIYSLSLSFFHPMSESTHTHTSI